ncbi:IstB-like ATP binding protein [Nitrosomonas marina]|uniref:IstB-like ATP binding protein n=1 Tax=Nitrosomonas marina TaxID=917 RepID=A0A1I0E4H8_9PROT|nr:IstB-like ATP binding protein [Nitrosomonas marina]
MITDRYARRKALYLHGMAPPWQEWQAEGGARQKPVIPEVWLDRLIATEQTDRKARSLNYQLHTARLPHHRELIHFDWAENPLTKARIEQLAGGALLFHLINQLHETTSLIIISNLNFAEWVQVFGDEK